MEQTPDQKETAPVADTGAAAPDDGTAFAAGPHPGLENAEWGVKAQAETPPEPPAPPTKQEVMEALGGVLKWGETATGLGAAMVVVCFAGDGVGAMQMLSPTVAMSDQDLVKFVKVMGQAVEQCKDTINKRRPGVLPSEGPLITDIRAMKGGIRALPRRR